MERIFVTKLKLTVKMLIALAVFVMFIIPVTATAQDIPPAQNNQESQQSEQQASDGLPEEANIQESLCAGASLKVGTECESEDQEGQSPDQVLNSLVADVINLFSWIVGIVAVIMIIVGGFRYITSGGDSTNVGNAKNTIMYALIGLVIVALSQWIVRFVLGRVVS